MLVKVKLPESIQLLLILFGSAHPAAICTNTNTNRGKIRASKIQVVYTASYYGKNIDSFWAEMEAIFLETASLVGAY